MTPPIRVLCMWPRPLSPGLLDPLRAVASVVVHEPDAAFLAAHLGEFDVYLAALHVRVDAALAARAAAGRLRLIYTPSTGLDHLDLPALAAHGVEVRSIRTEHELLDRVTATAELALALLLAVARRLPAAHAAAVAADWARDRLRGRQLYGQTLGVVGVGRLGTMMVRMGRGLGMHVVGHDPAPRLRVPGLDYLPFDELAHCSDAISLHLHLTPENEHFVSADRIARMKPGVILINTSRGRVIDEDALLAALHRGHVGGFGADVIDGEWRTDLHAHPLLDYARRHDQVVITPHVGGVTHGSQDTVYAFVVGRVVELLRAAPGVGGRVDAPAKAPA